MTQIVNLLLDRLVENLSQTLCIEYAMGHPYHADVVKKGLLQEDRSKKNLQIAVQGGDHEDNNYRDGILTLSEMDNIGFRAPAREVGGGEAWFRRGVVRVEFFMTGANAAKEDLAHEQAYEVLGLVQYTITITKVTGLKDTFGESASHIFCFGNTYSESGGAPSSFLWRGKVFWTALTWRP